MSRLPHLFAVLFLIFSGVLTAQVAPPPPPPPAGEYKAPEIPRRQWSLGFNGGLGGYSPSRTDQVSGHDHFQRTVNFSQNALGSWTDVNGRQHISFSANTSIGLSAGTMLANKKGNVFHNIELKFQQNKAFYTFIPPFPYTLRGAQFDGWGMMDKYLNYGLSYQCSFRPQSMERFIYTRVSFSRTSFHRNFSERITQGRFEDWSENGTGMLARTIKASPSSYMFSIEAGLRTFSEDWDRSFDYGFVFYAPFTSTYTDQYEFIQNNTSVGVSNTTYYGSTLMLNVRYTFYGKPKQHIDTTTPPPDIYVSTDTTRAIDVQESFTVHNKHVKITVWDRNEVDGDVISLFMNDELIKKDLKLKKRKKRFRVKLKPGSNILVMYAENLGEIPPNTAAVQIKDGKKKRNVNLVSDNGKSGAVELIYEPK